MWLFSMLSSTYRLGSMPPWTYLFHNKTLPCAIEIRESGVLLTLRPPRPLDWRAVDRLKLAGSSSVVQVNAVSTGILLSRWFEIQVFSMILDVWKTRTVFFGEPTVLEVFQQKCLKRWDFLWRLWLSDWAGHDSTTKRGIIGRSGIGILLRVDILSQKTENAKKNDRLGVCLALNHHLGNMVYSSNHLKQIKVEWLWLNPLYNWVGFNIFLFSPRSLGKWSNLTNIFSNGLVQPPPR